MAYADHSQASSRTTALVIVILVHIVLGYAFFRGLDMNVVKKVAEQVNVFNVKDPPKPKPPPPKPKDAPPPPPKSVVTPPQAIKAPVITNNTPPPPPAPPPPVIVTPAPPPPPVKASRAVPRGAPGTWVTTDDYPSKALAAEAQGTTGFKLDIGPDGRVINCTVTSSSGNADLDATTCRLLPRRARFKPAVGGDGQPMGDTYSSRVVWRMPQ